MSGAANANAADRREAVGAPFSHAAMITARDLTFDAIRGIAAQVRPGMTEGQAGDLAEKILQGMGMERLWHKTLVRFGPETLKTFHEEGDPGRVLADHDIFFIDIGVVWGGHEGDAGDTFVVGDDPDMAGCAQAARALWSEVADHWRRNGATGADLYRYGAERAVEAGWVLNLEIKGHRVCDFPHAIYRAGNLGDFGLCPATGLWILEIQIAHPSRRFGAFFEDLLYVES